jgi:hypothetical protein
MCISRMPMFLVIGDVASPVKDPELDWIHGRVDRRASRCDGLLLKISTEKTKFIPGPAR